jgi:hypothetical protein
MSAYVFEQVNTGAKETKGGFAKSQKSRSPEKTPKCSQNAFLLAQRHEIASVPSSLLLGILG